MGADSSDVVVFLLYFAPTVYRILFSSALACVSLHFGLLEGAKNKIYFLHNLYCNQLVVFREWVKAIITWSELKTELL